MPAGFAQYCIALEGLRIIVLDTLETGRHGGGFCEVRSAWLKARLAEQRDTPTVIVMHHPPLDVGIAWMDPGPDQPWIARFADAIAGHRQIRAIWCGHLHRPITASWKGITVTICPATAAELSLDLNPIDPDRPDDRPMVNADPPGYALHRWNGGWSAISTRCRSMSCWRSSTTAHSRWSGTWPKNGWLGRKRQA